MKRVLIILGFAVCLVFGCEAPTSTEASNKEGLSNQAAVKNMASHITDRVHPSSQPSDLFTLADAELILGESAHLQDSSSEVVKGTAAFSSSYIANAEDNKTKKTGAIFFVYEHYQQVKGAEDTYASILEANSDHEGLKAVKNMGDEAYYHSDGQNFHFILVRKGAKMFRMKVNKITSKTSVDEFHNVAGKITELL